jgi:hypothetical protein
MFGARLKPRPDTNPGLSEVTQEGRHLEFMAACYHFAMLVTDTSSAAQTVQFEIHRSMSGEQRLLLAFEMSMFARELSRARICQEHPEWTEAQTTRELVRLALLPASLPGLQ